MRPAPLNSQPPTTPSSDGCMSVPNRRPRPTGTLQSHCILIACRTFGGRIHHAAVVLAEVRRAALERVLVAAVDLEARATAAAAARSAARRSR